MLGRDPYPWTSFRPCVTFPFFEVAGEGVSPPVSSFFIQ